jgi:hypothetical protein
MVSDRRKMAGVRRGELERFRGVLTVCRRFKNGEMRVGERGTRRDHPADL